MKPMMSLKKMLVLSAAKELNKRAAKVPNVKAAKAPPLPKPASVPEMKSPRVAVGRAVAPQPNPNKIKQVRAGKSPGIAKMQQGLRVKPSKW